MRKLLILAVVFSSLPATSFAASPNLATADWSVNARPNLISAQPTDEAVVDFILALENGAAEHVVCQAQFADLRSSGALSLIVGEATGKQCSVMVVDKNLGGVGVTGLNWGPVIVKDIEGDGKLEVIGQSEFTTYQGAQHCVATWPLVWAWTGSGYADVSQHYKTYYEEKLVSLKQQIADAEATGATQGELQQPPSMSAPVSASLPPALPSADAGSGPAVSNAFSVPPPPPQQVLATPNPLLPVL